MKKIQVHRSIINYVPSIGNRWELRIYRAKLVKNVEFVFAFNQCSTPHIFKSTKRKWLGNHTNWKLYLNCLSVFLNLKIYVIYLKWAIQVVLITHAIPYYIHILQWRLFCWVVNVQVTNFGMVIDYWLTSLFLFFKWRIC